MDRSINSIGVPTRHVPVMLPDVLEALAPRRGHSIVDGTFGGGGYSRALLEAAKCKVFAIDRDLDAINLGESLVRRFSPRLTLIDGCFGDMEQLLLAHDQSSVDGIVLDIGVSSQQIDQPERGFSFQYDGPLDMRMGQSGPSAAEYVNQLSEADLSRVIAFYGEERRARAIARAIVKTRVQEPFTTTGGLAQVVARAVGPQALRGGSRIHPATKTFQAIRILVNDELGELVRALVAAERLLHDGGRLVVVSFHSLEDRIVKRFLSERAGLSQSTSRHRPSGPEAPDSSLKLVGPAVRRPRAHEIETNPRARSAKLRVAQRTNASIWPIDMDVEGRKALGVPYLGVSLLGDLERGVA